MSQQTDIRGRPDRLISVDDHIVEPGHVWVDRTPASLRERVPHLREDADGRQVWVYDGVEMPMSGLLTVAGRPEHERSPLPLKNYGEMLPAYYDPAARLEAMTEDGVIASLCFPTVPRFCGQIFLEAKDHDLALHCVRVYNDWILEEWAGPSGGRLIAATIIPLWDVALAAEEAARCIDLGTRAIIFSENVATLGCPSMHAVDRYWDPLWQVLHDTGTPVAIHIGSSSQLPKTSPDCPLIVTNTLSTMNCQATLVDWVLSGVLHRFDNLKLCLSEGGIGWIPSTLERITRTVEHMKVWATRADYRSLDGMGARDEDRRFLTEISPHELFRRQIYGCFIEDEHGLKHVHDIGIDNIMMETDFPHADATYPNSRQRCIEAVAGLNDEDAYKLTQDNARKLFKIPAELV